MMLEPLGSTNAARAAITRAGAMPPGAA